MPLSILLLAFFAGLSLGVWFDRAYGLKDNAGAVGILLMFIFAGFILGSAFECRQVEKYGANYWKEKEK